MPLLIDAYNVLHTTGVLPPEIAGIDVRGLVDLLRAGRFRHQRSTVVCDGIPGPDAPTGREGPVAILYSGSRTADEVIARAIRRSSIPRKLTIVSSDRAVLREARKRRCGTLRSEEFLARLAEDHEEAGLRKSRSAPRAGPAGPLPAEEVEQWVEAFDVRDAEFLPPPVEPGQAKPPPEPAAPAPQVFSPDLLAEAEAIFEEGMAEEPAPPPEAPPPPPEPEPERDESSPDAEPPAVPLSAFLPAGMMAEAESIMAEETARQQAEEAAAKAEADAAARAAAKSADAAKLDPLRAVLPDELIAQAEAIEEASSAEPPAPKADDEEVEEEEEARPQVVEDILPADILAEAESLLDEDEDNRPEA